MYIAFVDFEKAFGSLDRESLWKLVRHDRIPEKFIAIINKSTYDGMPCKVLNEGSLTEKFEVKTGVRQGCFQLFPFLFLLAVDWIMRESTEGRNDIHWMLWNQWDDLDFADDVALLAHNYNQMHEKTSQMEESAKKLGVSVSKDKTKSMRLYTTNNSPINIGERSHSKCFNISVPGKTC